MTVRRRDIAKALVACMGPLGLERCSDARSAGSYSAGNSVECPTPGCEAGWVNVRCFGAVGDGVHDDTSALQEAINAVNDWSRYSNLIGANDGSTPDYDIGGTVFLPRGIYKITSPILLAPNVTLRGAVVLGQFHGRSNNAAARDRVCTTIRAHFPTGTDWYVIDTGNWRQKHRGSGRAIRPYRAIDAADQFFGLDKDRQVGTACPACHIFDVRIDGNGRAFGGVRMQMWYYGRIDRVVVYGTKYVGVSICGSFEASLGTLGLYAPVGLNVQGTESLTQSGGEITVYCAATSSWVSANQKLIDTVFYDAQISPGSLDDSSAWYGLTLKGLLSVWTQNFTVAALAVNTCNVGVEVYAGHLNIQHWENEYIDRGALFLLQHGATCVCDGLSSKSTVPLACGDGNSKLVVRQPFFLATSTSFAPLKGEASSTFEVQLWDAAIPDQVLGTAPRLSTVNLTKIFSPTINGSPYTGSITLYVSTVGSPTCDGLRAAFPTTIDGALLFVVNNPHILGWKILLKDGEVHTITRFHKLVRQRIRFDRDFTGQSTATLSMQTPVGLDDCTLLINNIDVRDWTSRAAFAVSNTLTVNIGSRGGTGSPNFAIPENSAIFAAAESDSCRIFASGSFVHLTFARGSGLCSGGTDGFVVYEDSFANVSTVGKPALEAVSRNRVKKVVSSVV